jgi:integrase
VLCAAYSVSIKSRAATCSYKRAGGSHECGWVPPNDRQAAKMPFSVHPHMLRHATGLKLANQGVDTRSLQQFLGHKNIQHTVRYTELSPERFRDFWRD